MRPLDTLKVAKSKDVTSLYGVFNQRKTGSKWRDTRLRKALNYAINREELWKHAAKGNAYNLGGFIPPGAFGHNPNVPLYKYDTPKARALLEESGYPKGIEVKIITWNSWELEAQIMGRMLERIGLKVTLDILTWPQYIRKTYMPVLDKPPEEQDWDIGIFNTHDWHGHTGTSFVSWPFIEESEFRWIELDPDYEEMWRDMSRTVDSAQQERKIRNLVQRIYDRAYLLFIYSPVMLYAVNKEIAFVPQKGKLLRLKETSVTENHWSVRGKNN
jgi:peptide/nickel transport system substrate-binding protein